MSTLRILQFTDTHLLADPHGQVRGVRTLPRLQACIEHARRHCLPAGLFAVTGDLVQDQPEAYGLLELAFHDLGAPVLLAPGNHDVPAEMRRRLSHGPFQVGGARVAGPWTVLMLDTTFEVSGRGEGRLGPDALAALDADLVRHREQHVAIFLHHPPILMDSAGLDGLGLEDAPEVLAILDRHPNVRAVVWGHAHQALDYYRGHARYLCTPATCMQFRPRDPGFVVDGRPPGYRVIDLEADGGVCTEVVWLEGFAG